MGVTPEYKAPTSGQLLVERFLAAFGKSLTTTKAGGILESGASVPPWRIKDTVQRKRHN